MRSSTVTSFSGSTEGQVVNRRYRPNWYWFGIISWIIGSGMGVSTSMGEGTHETGGEDAGDGIGDDSGVIVWLYVLKAAICADGRRSLDFPNRAGTHRVRVVRRIAIGLSKSKSTTSCVTDSAWAIAWAIGVSKYKSTTSSVTKGRGASRTVSVEALPVSVGIEF